MSIRTSFLGGMSQRVMIGDGNSLSTKAATLPMNTDHTALLGCDTFHSWRNH